MVNADRGDRAVPRGSTATTRCRSRGLADYKPSIKGIERYQYGPAAASITSCSRASFVFGTRQLFV